MPHIKWKSIFSALILGAALLVPSSAITDAQTLVYVFTTAFLSQPLQAHLYHRAMEITQTIFLSLLITLHFIWIPMRLHVTGHWASLYGLRRGVFISNHSLYVDWSVIWALAWHFDCGDSLRIILKKSLQYIPVLGWGMKCFSFIFLSRDWEKDEQVIRKSCALLAPWPFWLLIFPEGTVSSKDTIKLSQAYIKKRDISFKGSHVLLPKTTGLHTILESLTDPTLLSAMGANKLEYVYDITLAYEGVKADQIPFHVHGIEKTFLLGAGPKNVHLHIRRFRLREIPVVDKAEFDAWLYQLYREKDRLLEEFYRNGSFIHASTESSCRGAITLKTSSSIEDPEGDSVGNSGNSADAFASVKTFQMTPGTADIFHLLLLFLLTLICSRLSGWMWGWLWKLSPWVQWLLLPKTCRA